MEREGAGVEKRLGGLDDSYVDVAKTAEASGKRQRGALEKTAKAVANVRAETRGLASDSRETQKSAAGISEAFGNAADRSVADLKRLQGALKAIGDEEGAVEIGMAIDQASKREAQAEIARFKSGLDDETVNVRIDYDRSQLQQVGTGFKEAASGIRAFEVLAGTVAIPGIISAVAGAIPLVVALAGRTAQLGSAFAGGLAGGAVIGGTAVAGMNVGLKAYGGLLRSTVSSTREVYLAENEAAAKRLENYRATQLQTQESRELNSEIDRSSRYYVDLQSQLGSAVFPAFTREIAYWNEYLYAFTPEIVATGTAVGGVTARFSEFVRTAQKGQLFDDIFGFISTSAVTGSKVLASMGRTGLRALQMLIGPANRVQQLILWATQRFEAFVLQSRNAGKLANAIGYLERRMFQVGHIIGYLIQAFVNMTRAANAAVDMEKILDPIVYGARAFRDFTAEGNRGASAITNFMNRSEPALRSFRGLVFEAVRQVLILANSLVSAGQSGGKIGTLATVINSVRDSLAPIRQLLQATFIQLAPALARLIPAVVEFASAFLGSSNVLVSFVNRITQLLNTFNSLPPGIKSVIIEAVALNSIMSLLGGPTIMGLIGGLIRGATTFATLRAANAASTAAMVASGNATAAMTLKQRIAAGATAAWSAVTRIASLAARGFGVALRFMLGPWGLLIAAIALGVTAIIVNWDKIRPALQPVISLFNRVKTAVGNLANVFTGVLTGNMQKAQSAFLRLPAGLRPFAAQLAKLALQIRVFVQRGLLWLRAQGTRLVAWWRSNWPQIQRVGGQVLTRLGQIIRSVAGPVFRFLLNGAKQIISWWRSNWPLIQRTGTTVFNALRRVVMTVMRAIWTGTIRPIVTTMVAFWRQNSQQLLSIARSVWNIIKTTISAAIRIVGNILKLGMQVITGDFKGANATLDRIWRIFWDAVRKIASNALNILKKLLSVAWNVIRSVASAAWDRIMNSAIGDKIQAGRERIGQIVQDLKSGLSGAWDAISKAANTAWTAIANNIVDPVKNLPETIGGIFDSILDKVNTVLGWVGIDPIGSGSGGGSSSPGGNGSSGRGSMPLKTRNRSKPIKAFARGGVVDGEDTFLVGDRGQREYVFNPSRPDNVPLMRQAAGEIGMGLVPEGVAQRGHRAGRYGRTPYVSAGIRRGLAPPWWATGADTLGPETHSYVPEMRQFVDDAEAEFPDIYTNSYTNHPIGYRQPYYRERSTDFWGSGGRGASIGTDRGDETSAWTIDRLGSDLNWLIWNGRMLSASGWGPDTSGFSHAGHQHTTAFASGPTATGGGSGGSLKAMAFEKGWNSLVQPIIDRMLSPLTGAKNVMVQAAGGAAEKVPEGIKEWAISKLGSSTGGGSGLSGTPAENRKLGEEMFGGSGLSGSFSDVDAIWTQESGWDHTAQNPSSSAFGIPQFLDTTWAQYGGVSKDAEGQIDKGYKYIGDRYSGSASEALAFKQANGWYGRGGMAVGPQLMGLAEAGANELVLPLGDRRVYSQVQGMFQIQQLREEFAGVRQALEEGITINDYGLPAREVIVEGTLSSMRGYARSTENREVVVGHLSRSGDLDRVGGK